ncbi:MAG: AAA family ATPase [Actinomycetota bacterium]
MRPLEVTLEGFKSYRFPQTFNLESRSLFGIVGPTGSGKSTILEAIIFALYGKTPRVERDTKKLINSQQEQARVQLSFEVDRAAWEVTRVLRRKGSSQTLLRRLDDASSDALTGERAASERIEEIVGLDFNAFCSSVSLPQGEFDRFLRATPAERSRILKGIFRLERVDQMRERAQATKASLEGQIFAWRATIEALPADPQTLLLALHLEFAGAQTSLQEITDALPGVLAAEKALHSAAETLVRLQDQQCSTRKALDRLPAEEELRELSDRREAAGSRLAGAGKALDEANSALDATAEAEKVALERTGGDAWFSAVSALIGHRARLASSIGSAEVEKLVLKDSVAELTLVLSDFLREAQKAERDKVCYARALAALSRDHAAHLLRRDLCPGEPCPVCEQAVAVLPLSAEPEGLAAAEEKAAQAVLAWEKARGLYERADRELELRQQRLSLADEGLAVQSSELDTVVAELLRMAGSDPESEMASRKEAMDAVREGIVRARAAREHADRAERGARSELEQVSASLSSILNQLTHTCGLLGIASPLPDAGLWESAKRIIEAGQADLERTGKQVAGVEADVLHSRRVLEAFRIKFGLKDQDRPADLLAEAKAELMRLELRIAEVEAGMAKRREAEGQIAELSVRKARYERLVPDFSDSKFTAFLLDEQRRLLARLGSEKFKELTGHYIFDDEGQFQIIDLRTGHTRSPDTLSGGETFLASLALALALAEAVALEGGRLGCFFLDEGFGSLDSESLDLALEGIEALAVPGRLIGLISHISGIQARLDDLIVLERSSDGSTEVAQHEGPIGYAPALI